MCQHPHMPQQLTKSQARKIKDEITQYVVLIVLYEHAGGPLSRALYPSQTARLREIKATYPQVFQQTFREFRPEMQHKLVDVMAAVPRH